LVNKLTVDIEKYYKSLLSNDGFKKSLKGDKPKKADKDKLKVETVEEKDERRKNEYFTSKDFVYD